jgi:oxygen-dependent protoporphyrinogen oxidase
MATAVIGAGVAGLVAAYELVKRGERPIIIEPSSPGGMLRSIQRDGFTLEAGPNVLVERPDVVQLFQELGMTDDVCYPAVQPYGQFVWCGDKACKVPSGFSELIRSSLFPWSVKLALPVRLLLPGLIKPKAEDVSILEFFTPLIGAQVTKNLLDPVLKGIYGGDVARLSARSIFPGLWSAAVQGLSLLGYMRQRPRGGKPAIFVVRGGIQRIAEALWARIKDNVDLISARADSVSRGEGGGYVIRCSNGAEVAVKSCIVTSAGAGLARLVSELDRDLSSYVSTQQYASLTVVHLSVPRREPLIRDAFGILFPGGMPENLLGVMFNSLIFPHVAPLDKHILTVIVGGAQAGHERPDEVRLREQVPLLLERYLGVVSADCLQITQWPGAIPQLVVGHHKLVAEFDRVEAANPGLAFVGVDRGGIGVSDRVRLAKSGVERIRTAKNHG